MIDQLIQEDILQSFVRNMPAAVAMFDKEMNYIMASQTWIENEGLQHVDIVGRSHYDLNPAIPAKWRETHVRCLQGEFLSSEKDFYEKEDGTVEWVKWKCHPWYNAQNEIGGVMLFSESITQKVQVESEKDKLARLVKQAPIYIFIMNRECELVYMNQVSEGRTVEDLVGMSVLDFVVPEHVEKKKKQIEQAFDTEVIQHGESLIYMADGETRWFESIYAPYYEGGKVAGVICYSTDIQLRKEIESQTKEFSRELAQKNEELEQYVHITSHDLKEPVRMIASYLQLLKMENTGLSAESQEYIDYAIEGAARIQTLSASLMRYTKLGKGGLKFEKVDLQELIHVVCQNLKTLMEESHAEVITENLPEAKGEKEQLILLFQNLVENAIKFNNSDRPVIHISWDATSQHVELFVKDNGIGFNQKYADKIFEAFERLHSRDSYDGAGMGLAICKRIVENHGGNLSVETTLGHGSTFKIELPV